MLKLTYAWAVNFLTDKFKRLKSEHWQTTAFFSKENQTSYNF